MILRKGYFLTRVFLTCKMSVQNQFLQNQSPVLSISWVFSEYSPPRYCQLLPFSNVICCWYLVPCGIHGQVIPALLGLFQNPFSLPTRGFSAPCKTAGDLAGPKHRWTGLCSGLAKLTRGKMRKWMAPTILPPTISLWRRPCSRFLLLLLHKHVDYLAELHLLGPEWWLENLRWSLHGTGFPERLQAIWRYPSSHSLQEKRERHLSGTFAGQCLPQGATGGWCRGHTSLPAHPNHAVLTITCSTCRSRICSLSQILFAQKPSMSHHC